MCLEGWNRAGRAPDRRPARRLRWPSPQRAVRAAAVDPFLLRSREWGSERVNLYRLEETFALTSLLLLAVLDLLNLTHRSPPINSSHGMTRSAPVFRLIK